MKNLRSTLLTALALAAALALLSGCNGDNADASAVSSRNSSRASKRVASGPRLASGSTMQVTIGSTISSKTAAPGDAWHGTLAENLVGTNGEVVPAGTAVNGIVTAAAPAKRGARAMLDLGVRGIQRNGRTEAVSANTDEIVAGSTRARNLGAIAGGAVAGGVVGNNVGDHNHTVLGAVIGGATAAGLVAKSQGYQVELKQGTVVSFVVAETVTLR